MRTKIGLLALMLVLTSGVARAGTISYSGYFNDPANAALVWSDLLPARFGDDGEIANNVALHGVTIVQAGPVTFESVGFAAGGADPYVTLFQGTGPGATVLGSNYAQAFSTGGDFLLTFDLPAGGYTVAMGVFANMSIAENVGSGTLGDGFTFLGAPSFLGNYYYELDIAYPDGPVPPIPEPATLLLIGSGMMGCFARRKKA